MNILFLSELIYPHGSGAELATFLYAKLLSSRGFKTVIITSRFAEERNKTESNNLAIYRIPLIDDETRKFKYSTLRRPDILLSSLMRKMMRWADTVYVPRFWFSTIPLARIFHKPVITHLHDYIPVCPLAIAYDSSRDHICYRYNNHCTPRCIYTYEKIQRSNFTDTLLSTGINSTIWHLISKSVKMSDAIICVSNCQREIFLKKEPELQNRTYVVRNPLPEIAATPIEDDDFGYFGGVDRLKGFHFLCQAMSRVNHAKLVMTRINATKFSEIGERLREYLAKLGFETHGSLNNEQYQEVYKKIRAVIVPSIWNEPSSYVVDEAMLRGRVVIASRIGGIPEKITGCEGVFLVEPGNSEQLAETINMISKLTRQEVTELGLKNREWILGKQINTRTIDDFIKILDNSAHA